MKDLIAEAILQEMGKYRTICEVQGGIHCSYVISDCGRLTVRVQDDAVDVWDHDWATPRRSYALIDPDSMPNTVEAALLILRRTGRKRLWLYAAAYLIDRAIATIARRLGRA